jgi:hypothetical protein
VGARHECGAVHQRKSASETLGGRCFGGAAGVVHERKGGQAAIKKLGAPIVWTLYAEFYVYAHSSDPYLAPAAILNPLLDALEAALAPSPTTGIQNLGLPQMVQHAYIAGKLQTDEGVLGDQAIAIVPVEILCF